MVKQGLWTLVLLFVPSFLLFSQTDSLSNLEIEAISIEATRLESDWLSSTTSIYHLSNRNRDQLAQNSLQENLIEAPSVFSLNANNRAQDLRISIRGFGSRAAFGVRGVKIIVDGIPETTTDGQGQLDNLNLGIIKDIEVLNNGSSSLYGNASGGVLNIKTLDEKSFDSTGQFLHLGSSFQSYNTQQHQFTAGKQFNKSSFIIHGNRHESDGYREHAAFKSTNFNVRFIQKIASTGKLEAILNYMDSPIAEDPGGVNEDLFNSNPTIARDRNVLFDAGEAIDQFKGSLRYSTALTDHSQLSSYGFISNRNFRGRLPFENGGIIRLDRGFWGHGSHISINSKASDLWASQWGYDLSNQADERQRFNNVTGAQSDQSFAQDETFTNIGVYGTNVFTFNQWTAHVALRYDFNNIEAEDLFLSDGDGSGEIDLNSFNYTLGLGYELANNQRLFATHATSFETPTLNELSNNPDGSGFNAELKAQQANHFELGWKGFWNNESPFQVSAFYIKTDDELLPFELEAFPGRTFFRNVGATERLGLELFSDYTFSERFKARTNWTFNDFSFQDYVIDDTDFAGKTLPGIPTFQGNIQLDYKPISPLGIFIQNQVLGKIYTNDINDVAQETKNITNLSISYRLERTNWSLQPYVGSNNLFGTAYADNIRINAFGNRYFEAAPDQFYYGGLKARF